jgi:hypothetical protein
MRPTMMPRQNRQIRAEPPREAARGAELRRLAQALDHIAQDVRIMQQRLDALLSRPELPHEPDRPPTAADDEEWEAMRRVLEGRTRKVEAVIAMLNRTPDAGRRFIREAHMR